ncbi:MAG TPA: hypothetical protein PKD49_10030 [Hyphomicrobium sp.]|nr:hypothetical protein [Hyphomicrobium sp.]
MSVQKLFESGFAAVVLALAGLMTFTTIADAHPHKRHRRSHHYYNNSRDVEVQVTINRLVALDKGDAFSNEDFYARVTIGGQVFKSQPVRQTDGIIPNWRFAAIVPAGRTDVKIEVFDKDIAADDQIDINRIDPKRDLDFVVNSRTCRIEGMASEYRCRTEVTRAGGERKRAEMTFTVDVNYNP